MDIAKILYRNGLNENDIKRFFDHAGEFTAERIGQFLNTISGISTKDLTNLGTDLFTLFTGGMLPQDFYNQIERVKNQFADLTELQKKYNEEVLTAEEMQRVNDMLGQSEFLDDFLSGSLDVDAFLNGQINTIKRNLEDAISAAQVELSRIDINDATRLAVENSLLLYQDMYDNLDEMVFSGTMDEYYQAQIDYIQQMNQEIQEQINLEQKRIDMNRSMLSLNRQIRALESDTSYGAQARLEELRITRQSEMSQREAYIMDTVANQAISDLQDKIQNEIADATQMTASNTAGMLAIMQASGGGGTFESYTGNTVKGKPGYQLSDNGII
jgi:hypothetical protein